MSVNVSSTFSFFLVDHCTNAYIAINAIRTVFLLPLSTIILYLGFQKWRQQHSFRTASHSDLFTYHLVAMELIFILGWFCNFCAYTVHVAALDVVGNYLASISFHGHMLFHILTCVERYLAVVHPIIYMGLKNTRGVRIRNISIVCVWVLCFVLVNIRIFLIFDSAIEFFCLLAVTILVTCYCSVSVLCVLIRPGPGDGAREQEQVDQSKQRAFNTIIAISAALWLWFVGLLVAFVMRVSQTLNADDSCLVAMTVIFLNLPSCLVSLLLYLHRAGKLTFSFYSRE